jgi:hypothetical protein
VAVVAAVFMLPAAASTVNAEEVPGTMGQPAAPSSQPATPGCSSGRLLADEFFAEGDYFRAITEYRREIFQCADPGRQRRFWLRIGDSYLRAKRQNEAMRVFDRLSRDPAADTVRAIARYRLAVSHIEGGVYREALRELARCRADAECLRLVGSDRLALAEAVASFEAREWTASERTLVDFELRFPASNLRRVVGPLREQARVARKARRVSPVLAGLLSAVIPGLGQLYEGRYRDGVQAFILVGALGGGAAGLFYYEAHSSRSNYALPGLLAAAAGVFYLTNVYGAANGARMTNLMNDARLVGNARAGYQEAVWGPW